MDDIDMDLDLGSDLGYPDNTDHVKDPTDYSQPVSDSQQAALGPLAPDLGDAEPLPTKVHLRGLDDLTTELLWNYSLEHFPKHVPKIEWIDDTSANFVYPTPELASSALLALSHHSTPSSTLSPLTIRPAKFIPTHPSSRLFLRTATTTDRKAPRAREQSRFYLLHPELDPQERRRRSLPRHRNSNHRRRTSHSNSSSPARGDSYRPSRQRSRSASPGRARKARDSTRRRRTPPPRYSREDSHAAANIGKELFPVRKGIKGKELLLNKSTATSLKNELFPHKLKANDNGMDVTADLFASKLQFPLVDRVQDDGGEGSFPLRSDAMSGARQTQPDRIRSESANRSSRALNGGGEGFSIKGSAGIQIRGTAVSSEQKVKELFPQKVGNRGKELFAERSKNRADMYY